MFSSLYIIIIVLNFFFALAIRKKPYFYLLVACFPLLFGNILLLLAGLKISGDSYIIQHICSILAVFIYEFYALFEIYTQKQIFQAVGMGFNEYQAREIGIKN
jgi:hypothetical protein